MGITPMMVTASPRYLHACDALLMKLSPKSITKARTCVWWSGGVCVCVLCVMCGWVCVWCKWGEDVGGHVGMHGVKMCVVLPVRV